jgi:hypothetical protein
VIRQRGGGGRGEESEEESEHSEDDMGPKLEGAYNPKDYAHLQVTNRLSMAAKTVARHLTWCSIHMPGNWLLMAAKEVYQITRYHTVDGRGEGCPSGDLVRHAEALCYQ